MEATARELAECQEEASVSKQLREKQILEGQLRKKIHSLTKTYYWLSNAVRYLNIFYQHLKSLKNIAWDSLPPIPLRSHFHLAFLDPQVT